MKYDLTKGERAFEEALIKSFLQSDLVELALKNKLTITLTDYIQYRQSLSIPKEKRQTNTTLAKNKHTTEPRILTISTLLEKAEKKDLERDVYNRLYDWLKKGGWQKRPRERLITILRRFQKEAEQWEKDDLLEAISE